MLETRTSRHTPPNYSHYRSCQPSIFHDDQATFKTSSQMERIPVTIPIRYQINTRERERKTWLTYTEIARLTKRWKWWPHPVPTTITPQTSQHWLFSIRTTEAWSRALRALCESLLGARNCAMSRHSRRNSARTNRPQDYQTSRQRLRRWRMVDENQRRDAQTSRHPSLEGSFSIGMHDKWRSAIFPREIICPRRRITDPSHPTRSRQRRIRPPWKKQTLRTHLTLLLVAKA